MRRAPAPLPCGISIANVAVKRSGDRTENVLWRLLHGEVDGIAPRDLLRPNEEGCAGWAKAMQPEPDRLMALPR